MPQDLPKPGPLARIKQAITRLNKWATSRFPPKWTDLRRMGNSRLMKSSYYWMVFVPIAAHMLPRKDIEIGLPFGDATLTLLFGLPFSWKLFYLGAVSIAIGSILFTLYCPPLIRHYGSYGAFAKAGEEGTKQDTQEDQATRFHTDGC